MTLKTFSDKAKTFTFTYEFKSSLFSFFSLSNDKEIRQEITSLILILLPEKL